MEDDNGPQGVTDAEARARKDLEREVEQARLDRGALARSEARLRRIVDSNIAGVAFWRMDGSIVDANDAFLRIVGYTRDDLRSGALRWPALLAPESGPLEEAARATLDDRGAHAPLEISLVRKDLERVPVLLGDALLGDGEAGLSFVLDRSEIKRKEAALRAAEERIRMLLEAAPVSLFNFDRAGTLTASEGSLLRAPGHDPIGRPLFERWMGAPALSRLLSPVRAGMEVRDRVQMGERTIELLLRPLPGTEGGIGAGLDVTESARAAEERARLQEKLLQSQKLEGLGALAGGIAHDFNNLLAGIVGNAAAALAELPEGHAAREPLRDVIHDARRATTLTRQMLAYAGGGKPNPEPVDLSEEARALQADLELPAPGRLELRLEGALPPVSGDRDQLRQALLALAANAREALPGGRGTVTVSTGLVELAAGEGEQMAEGTTLPAGWYARLEVADDGSGMDDATRARAFDPFFSTKLAGRGLGLAEVLGIVRAHRGGLRLRSAPGAGTAAQIYLPVASGAKSPMAPQLHAGARPPARGVLIVDDEPQVRAAARRLLQSRGHPVSEASDGAEAVRALQGSQGTIGVVLLDLSMPGPSGAQIFRELREVEPEVRIILCSGYPREVAAAEMGVEQLPSFLSKPYTPDELLDRVSAELGRAL